MITLRPYSLLNNSGVERYNSFKIFNYLIFAKLKREFKSFFTPKMLFEMNLCSSIEILSISDLNDLIIFLRSFFEIINIKIVQITRDTIRTHMKDWLNGFWDQLFTYKIQIKITLAVPNQMHCKAT